MPDLPGVVAGPRSKRFGWMGDSILRRMLRNSLVLLGGKGVNGLLSLATIAIAVRALGLEEYGVLVLIHTFTIVVARFSKFQSWQAVLRYGAPTLEQDRPQDFRRLVRFTLLLDFGSGIIAAALAVGGAFVLGPLLGWPIDAVADGALYGLSVLFMVSATPTGILRLFDRFDILAIQSNIAWLVRLTGAAIAYAAGGGLTVFLIVWFLAGVASGVTLFASGWWEMRRRGYRGGVRVGWRSLAVPFPGIWRFVWMTNFTATANVGFSHLGTLLAGALLGTGEAALFRIARQIANALTKPARLLVQVVYPEFARLVAAGDLPRLRQILGRSLALACLASAVCLAVLVVAGPLLLRLIGGAEAEAAQQVLLWLSVAALVQLCAFPLEPALISLGGVGTALAVRVGALLLFIPLLYLCINEFQLLGAGVATLVTTLALLAGQLWPTFRRVAARKPVAVSLSDERVGR